MWSFLILCLSQKNGSKYRVPRQLCGGLSPLPTPSKNLRRMGFDSTGAAPVNTLIEVEESSVSFENLPIVVR